MAASESARARGLDFSPSHRLPKILRPPEARVEEPIRDPEPASEAPARELASVPRPGPLMPNYTGVAMAVLIAVPLGIAAMLVFGDLPGR